MEMKAADSSKTTRLHGITYYKTVVLIYLTTIYCGKYSYDY